MPRQRTARRRSGSRDMKAKPIVTVLGAASTTFGPKVLRDIINHPQLDGCTFRFVDVHEQRLAIYDRLARRIADQIDHSVQIESSGNRKAMLKGADYVIVSVEVGHYELWQQDFSIPVRAGVRQVTGELGGVGGLFHSLRQIPLHLEIARDIEAICPAAMVLVCSNPLNRICLAMRRYSGVGEVIGLCHGVEITENFLARRVLDLPGDQIESTAAGVNHFTWILDLRHRSTGEDLHPKLAEGLKRLDPKVEGLSRKLFEVYGYYPACGDAHIGEYISYAWEFVGLDGPPLGNRLESEHERWRLLDKLSRGSAGRADYAGAERAQAGEAEELRLDEFFQPRSWVDTLAFPIMAATESHRLHRMPAVNMLNAGTIDNLPADVFVESPAVVDGSGVRPIRIGELPKPLAAFCRRDVDQMELTVEAAVTGDRRRVVQAALLDPVVDNVRTAERVVDQMLREQARYLPQFV